ncbi:MAG TPA: type IV pilus assembly protein PilM [Candidatus Paceibacterota bacterium]|nr:type IV pilus assembly protein PilM [Candidatus Paceibacterota bacterium]
MTQDLLLKFFPVPKFLSRPAIGLDISDRSVKFMELLKEGDKFKLGRFGEIDIPIGVIEEGELKQPEVFRKILLDLKAKWHFSNFFISLPDDHSYTIHLDLPALKPEEIYGAIELQIEEYVPLPASEVVFDYEVLPQSEKTKDLSVGVMTFPCKMVESYQEIFASVNLNLLAIETQGGALTRALYEADKNSNMVIVDLGRNHTAIFWIQSGVVIRAASAPVGGMAITHNLQKALNIEFEEAEKIKITQGLLRSEANKLAFEAMIPVISAIRDEIERHTTFWFGQGEDKEVKLEQIILTGGQSSLPGFAEYLSTHIGCPVVVGNPWVKVFPAGETVANLSFNQALRYVTAIGLALRNFI